MTVSLLMMLSSNLSSTDSAPENSMNAMPPNRQGAMCPPTSSFDADPKNTPSRFLRPWSDGNSFPEISSLIIAAGQHVGLTFCLAVFFAFALGSIAVALFPAQFQSVGYIQVRQRENYVLTSQQSRTEDAAFVRAQELLVVQQQTLEKALKDPNLVSALGFEPTDSTVPWLRSQIKATIPNGTEVMSITASNSSQNLSWHIANAVTTAYLEDSLSRLRSSRDRRQLELEKAAKEADQKLRDRWLALEEMAGKLGTGSPQSLSVSEQIQIQGYRDASSQLRNVQLQRNQLEIQLNEERRKLSRSIELSEADLMESVRNEPEVIARRQKLASIDTKLREMLQLVPSPDSPRVKRLREDRDFYAKQLDDLVKEIAPRLKSERLQSQDPNRDADLEGLERQIAILKEEEDSLRDSMTKLESNMETADARSGVQLEVLRHEIEREERLAHNLWKAVEELRIEDQAEPRISLIEMPKVPDHPDRSKQWKAAGVAALFGVLLATLLVGYVEWKLCRIRHPDDVALHTDIEIFGTGSFCSGLPWLWKLRNAKHDPLISGVNEVAAQLFLKASAKGSLPSVMVTSSISTEPRFVVATQLATALTRTGKRTILIDCDASGTELGKKLGCRGLPGLAQLEPDEPFQKFIVRPHQSEFDFLPIGNVSADSTLVAVKVLPSLLKALKEKYEAVVVHASPILNHAESVLVATQVDTTVFSIVMGKSRWNLLAAAHHRLQFAHATVLGAVFHIPGWRFPGQKTEHANSSPSLEEVLEREIEQLQGELDAISAVPDLQNMKPNSRQLI